jgi:cell filamentation protein
MSKYAIGGSQGRYQAGSNDTVLENRLGITDSTDMDEAELVLLEKLYRDVLFDHLPQEGITVDEIKTWHRRWLGNVYEWAGEERSVNMSKGAFQFAAAAQIASLLNKFEQEFLRQYTHSTDYTLEQLIEAIAIVHIEFILIHPFRDGNGRLSRLLADVMAVQAGFQPLDYSCWDADKSAYFSAIEQGLSMNYAPMKELVKCAINETE